MAVIYAGLAIVCALALTSNERRRDVGYLRTMGASERQAMGLTLIEQLPSAIAAGVIGALFGGVLTWLIIPGLDIGSLYPADQEITIGVNWLIALAQILGLLVVTVGAAALFAIVARRRDLNDVLRAGD
jgi:putative ABC transport system permease protein